MEPARAGRDDTPGSANPTRLGGLALAACSSLLFLFGGIATYVLPALTAPLYILGSLAMLAHTAMTVRGNTGQRPHGRRLTAGLILPTGAAAVVVVTAFWAGYFV